MRVVYRPQVRHDIGDGAVGWMLASGDLIQFPPDVPVDVPDDLWTLLEHQETVARMLASGELQAA